jgi:DNA-directed RNA polymerase specialized sigma24 family protein
MGEAVDEAGTDSLLPTRRSLLLRLRDWRQEWEQHVMNTAFRRLRSKVSAQQLLIFRLATLGELPLTQVAGKLGVSLAQVYLARHRVGKRFQAEVQKLQHEGE